MFENKITSQIMKEKRKSIDGTFYSKFDGESKETVTPKPDSFLITTNPAIRITQ